MDVHTAPSLETAPPKHSSEPAPRSATGWTLLVFVAVWALCQALFHTLPYIQNGSDVVFGAKLRIEEQSNIFPSDASITRVLIFGNSKILAGFLPSRFDQLSVARRPVASFNSGFPGSDLFLPPLASLCARGQAPHILLLTLPWNPDPPKRGIFHFIQDDHAVVTALFPFRNFLRDVTAFLFNASSHGGMVHAYRQAQQEEQEVVAARGYYLITEQSHFPGGRLPDDFHIASDEPAKVVPRRAPALSAQADELNRLIRQYHIDCYYVPFYLREGEAAPASPYDEQFAAQVEQSTACRLIGPDYYLYPNRLFADQTHLNQNGARVYTAALYELLKDRAHALQ